MTAEIPTAFSHSVKIEQSAKGARITVHVDANSGPEAIKQAITLYLETQKELLDRGQAVAPVEVK